MPEQVQLWEHLSEEVYAVKLEQSDDGSAPYVLQAVRLDPLAILVDVSTMNFNAEDTQFVRDNQHAFRRVLVFRPLI